MYVQETLIGFIELWGGHEGGREQRNRRRSWEGYDQDTLPKNKSKYSDINKS